MELDGLSIYWNQMKKEQMFYDLDLADLKVNKLRSLHDHYKNVLSML